MTAYQNLGGDSGVSSYETTDDSITVQFNDGWFYLYDYGSPGPEAVETMKELAASGRGLNSFISSVVKKRFARKWR